MDVRYYDAQAVAAALPYGALIEALRAAFAAPPMVPERQHLDLDPASPGRMTLLSMPAWVPGGLLGHKLLTITPGNAARGLGTVNGFYLMFEGETGRPIAMLDAAELTARRTAATSALAARYLARPDAETLLMVGAGEQAHHLAEAHAAVRPYRRLLLWARDAGKAAAFAETLRGRGLPAEPVSDLEAACRIADVVCTATSSRAPLVRGGWLRPGSHLDLVGGFRPDMRECDTEAVSQAAVFVDTYKGALKEAGELVGPLSAGQIGRAHILAELGELARGDHAGRTADAHYTLFKSVGAALEDYAAASMVVGADRSVQFE